MEVKNKVSEYIRKNHLLTHEGLHLVALSGGADSVALLLILHRLGYRVEAVHCNFHLRGEESNRDEEFVKDLCNKNNIKIHLIHFDTREYALLHQVSIEMAARELRYRYFEQLRQDIEAETVCVAHHRDDAVETLLMNLLRGSGIHGLTGIRNRNGHIVRPLLCVSRQEIEEFLHSIAQEYVVDSTNLETNVLRNKIRLQLLPMMEQIQAGSTENIARTSYYLSEAERVYNQEMGNELSAYEAKHESTFSIPFSSLSTAPSPLCLLNELLAPFGFNRIQIEQILAHLNDVGKEFCSSRHILVVDRDGLIVEPYCEPIKPMVIPETGRYRLDENVCFNVSQTNDLTVSKTADVATLDAARIQFPLTIRPIQQGDRFQPYGMNGQKLVSDFLTDLKIPLTRKRRQLIVADATGHIVWVVGHRIDHHYRITSQTSSVLRISL